MFNTIIRISIVHRYLVLGVTLLLALLAVFAYQHLIIDAVPDITNVQVQINAEAQGYSPFEVEQRITVPLEYALSGIPGLEHIRSLSRYGLSQVTAVFSDQTDIYFARQLIAQRLQEAQEKLPAGISPTMGPIATGLGEIYMYTVESSSVKGKPEHSLEELRELQDWVIKPQLRNVPGVVEINSIGGAAKQILILPDLDKLRSYELNLESIAIAVRNNNSNVGAGFIEQFGEQLLIRVPAQAREYTDLGKIVVGTYGGTPVYLHNVASIEIGSELRNGAATKDSKEVVLGTVFMLIGQNGREVSQNVAKKLQEIKKILPQGVRVRSVYDRSDLVNSTIATVRKNLIEGALLVIAILFFALGNIRAALITACIIPLSMLFTIFGMVQGNISANLMSLGALDFGLIVDGAVILVENCIRRIAEDQARLGRTLSKSERLGVCYEAATEVRQATMFGELIIMIVYLPILTLGGVEGKMYQPMAITVLFALFAAFILSLTFVPAAVASFISGPLVEHPAWLEKLKISYHKILDFCLVRPIQIIVGSIVIFVFSIFIFLNMGSEFVPSLDEGDIAMHALRIPGTSLSQAIKMQHRLEDAVRNVPEVSHMFAKLGTAEIATDPMPPSVADGFIILKPRSAWPDPTKPKLKVVSEIESIVKKIPGNNYEFTQPIEMRFNELIAGVRSDVAVKVFGDNPTALMGIAEKLEKLLVGIPGASDVKIEQTSGLPMVVVHPNPEKLARYGLNADSVQSLVRTAYNGEVVSKYYAGDRNFPIVVRLKSQDRINIDTMATLPVTLPLPVAAQDSSQDFSVGKVLTRVNDHSNSYVNLGDVADIKIEEGPNQISRESGRRRVVVTLNIRERDLGSFVEEAQAKVERELTLPVGYWLSWGGQYENLISARERLSIVVPLVLLSVFALIVVTLKSLRYSLLVFSGVPFAVSGGILALWLRDIPFSISAAVGFIALSGVSVLNGLVLCSFAQKKLSSTKELFNVVRDSAISRLRPVLMTALVASLGFIPMAISQGAGSEVQRPLATVVIGGIISSTILTLMVLPCLLLIFGKSRDNL